MMQSVIAIGVPATVFCHTAIITPAVNTHSETPSPRVGTLYSNTMLRMAVNTGMDALQEQRHNHQQSTEILWLYVDNGAQSIRKSLCIEVYVAHTRQMYPKVLNPKPCTGQQ